MDEVRRINDVTGLSDEELAMILGVSKGSIYNYKTKSRSLPSPALTKLGKLIAKLSDSEALEKVTAELRKLQIQQLDIITKYRQARIHKLQKIINHKLG